MHYVNLRRFYIDSKDDHTRSDTLAQCLYDAIQRGLEVSLERVCVKPFSTLEASFDTLDDVIFDLYRSPRGRLFTITTHDSGILDDPLYDVDMPQANETVLLQNADMFAVQRCLIDHAGSIVLPVTYRQKVGYINGEITGEYTFVDKDNNVFRIF